MEKVKTPTKSNPSTPSKKNKIKPSQHTLETIHDESPLTPIQQSLNERLKILEGVPATPLRARWLSMLNELPQTTKLSCDSQFTDLSPMKSVNETPLPKEICSLSITNAAVAIDELGSNEQPDLSFPSATNFINTVIHNEVINGDKVSDSQKWMNDDILVLDTQPDDYEVLNDSTNNNQSIPETQITTTNNDMDNLYI